MKVEIGLMAYNISTVAIALAVWSGNARLSYGKRAAKGRFLMQILGYSPSLLQHKLSNPELKSLKLTEFLGIILVDVFRSVSEKCIG